MSVDEEILAQEQQPDIDGVPATKLTDENICNGDGETTVVNGFGADNHTNGDEVEYTVPFPSKFEEIEEHFQKTAKWFLAVHREEVAERDSEIENLQAELDRVSEALKSLEESKAQTEAENQANIDSKDEEVAAPSAEEETGIEVKEEQEEQGSSTEQKEPNFTDLVQDDTAKAIEDIHTIWQGCVTAVKSITSQDLPPDCISNWNSLQPADLEDMLPKMGPISISASNTNGAKQIRTMIIMALLAQSLEEYIFTPNYLLEDDDELRYVLRALNDNKKKSCLRSLLLLVSEEKGRKEDVKAKRASNAVTDVVKVLEKLFPAELLENLKVGLEREMQNATVLWEPLQHYESHYEVNTTASPAPWDWKSVHLDEDELHDIHSREFVSDEAVLVVFPRILALDRSKRPSFTPIYPGIVLQKSQHDKAQVDPAEVSGEDPTEQQDAEGEESGSKVEPDPAGSSAVATTEDAETPDAGQGEQTEESGEAEAQEAGETGVDVDADAETEAKESGEADPDTA